MEILKLSLTFLNYVVQNSTFFFLHKIKGVNALERYDVKKIHVILVMNSIYGINICFTRNETFSDHSPESLHIPPCQYLEQKVSVATQNPLI